MAATYDPSDFPPFAVTTDLVMLTVRPPRFEVLLVRRAADPFAGAWALPGGFVAPDHSLLDAARAKLVDKTGVAVDETHLEQIASFGQPNRDPRMRVVSVAWLALLADPPEPIAGTDTDEAAWVDLGDIDTDALAFDHATILNAGIERARNRIEYTTLAAQFCGDEFTIGELRSVYETLWDTELDPANFHRKVVASEGFVAETGATSSGGRGRPARLYRRGPAATLDPPLHRPQP